MELFGTKKNSKKLVCYSCEICAFSTSNKNDYARHLKTIKHLGTKMETKNSEKLQCNICEREYVNSSGLWKHKKKCVFQESVFQEPAVSLETTSDKEMIITLLKQNAEQARQSAEQARQSAELHAKVLELCKNGIINNTINNNSNNKTFNLQIYLNETCRDAVNLEDFAKAVVLQLSDLDRIGEVGFVDGMTNIIESKLSLLGVHKRPIHCTDAKREVFYVKDNDKWSKDEGNLKMRRLIQRMDRKLAPLLITFGQKKNNGYSTDSEIIKHQQATYEILGGKNDDEVNADAIIRRMTKKMLIM